MTLGDRHEHAHYGSPASADPGSDLRFSPRPNRAHEIAWRPWGQAAFDEARRSGKPCSWPSRRCGATGAT